MRVSFLEVLIQVPSHVFSHNPEHDPTQDPIQVEIHLLLQLPEQPLLQFPQHPEHVPILKVSFNVIYS